MSADNGIYIAKLGKNDYRVTHAQAIESLNYYQKDSQEWKNEIKNYFGNAKSFKTKEEALIEGHKMEKEILNNPNNMCPIVEYGVSYIGEFII